VYANATSACVTPLGSTPEANTGASAVRICSIDCAWEFETPASCEAPFAKTGLWIPRTMLPNVLRPSPLPVASFTPFVITTAYSVFSWSGGSASGGVPAGAPGSATGTAGWRPMAGEHLAGPHAAWICGGWVTYAALAGFPPVIAAATSSSCVGAAPFAPSL